MPSPGRLILSALTIAALVATSSCGVNGEKPPEPSEDASGTAAAVVAPTAWKSATLTVSPGKKVTKPFLVNAPVGTLVADVRTAGLTSGRSAYHRLTMRGSGTSFYDAELRVTAGGAARLQLQRVDANTRVVLKTVELKAVDPTKAQRFAFELSQANGSPVLKASTWLATAKKPAWMLSHTDSSAAKRISGVEGGVSTYAAGNVVKAATAYWTNMTLTKGIVPPAYRNGWGEPSFKDEFETATLASKWAVRDRLNLSYDWAQVRKENVVQSGGFLKLYTQRLATPIYAAGRERSYSSAYVDTIKSNSQSYGRWEIRAKLPTAVGDSKGIWPAFWLRPDDGGHGEIDILEAYGSPSKQAFDGSKRTEATVHFDSVNKVPPYKVSSFTPVAVNVNDGQFHTWAVEWKPDSIAFFLDNKIYYTVKRGVDKRFDAVYRSGRKYNIRLNVQVGSDYWGEPNDTQTAAKTEYTVDYVRVWSYRP